MHQTLKSVIKIVYTFVIIDESACFVIATIDDPRSMVFDSKSQSVPRDERCHLRLFRKEKSSSDQSKTILENFLVALSLP